MTTQFISLRFFKLGNITNYTTTMVGESNNTVTIILFVNIRDDILY